MRIAVIYPRKRDWPKYEWVRDALGDLGHQAWHARTIDDVAIADRESDMLLFGHKDAGLNWADVVKIRDEGRNNFWVQWVFDLMALDYFESGPSVKSCLLVENIAHEMEPTSYLRMMRLMDVVFVKERGLLHEYHELGVNAKWLDQACPSFLGACCHREDAEFDVLMFGSGRPEWRDRRRDVRALLRSGATVVWSGHSGGGLVGRSPECRLLSFCPPELLPELASRAKIVLCCDYRHDIDGYWSDRLWIALGMGACVLRRTSPGLPVSETNYGVVPWIKYDDEYELDKYHVELLGEGATHRAELGAMARKWVMENHTYQHRCRELLEKCEKLRRDRAVNAAAPVV